MIARWMRNLGIDSVLVRPDHFVFGGASGETPEGDLLASLAEALGGRTKHLSSDDRSEEHTSELQSLMRISYAVFCLKKKIRKDERFHMAFIRMPTKSEKHNPHNG